MTAYIALVLAAASLLWQISTWRRQHRPGIKVRSAYEDPTGRNTAQLHLEISNRRGIKPVTIVGITRRSAKPYMSGAKHPIHWEWGEDEEADVEPIGPIVRRPDDPPPTIDRVLPVTVAVRSRKHLELTDPWPQKIKSTEPAKWRIGVRLDDDNIVQSKRATWVAGRARRPHFIRPWHKRGGVH